MRATRWTRRVPLHGCLALAFLVWTAGCSSRLLPSYDKLELEASRYGFVSVGAPRLVDYDTPALVEGRERLRNALLEIQKELRRTKPAPERVQLLRDALIRSLKLTVRATVVPTSGEQGGAPVTRDGQEDTTGEGSAENTGSSALPSLLDLFERELTAQLEPNQVDQTRLRIAVLKFVESELQDLQLDRSSPPRQGYRRMVLSLQLTAYVREESGVAGVASYIDLYPYRADVWAHEVGQVIRKAAGPQGFTEEKWNKQELQDQVQDKRGEDKQTLREKVQGKLEDEWANLRKKLSGVHLPSGDVLGLPTDPPDDPEALAHGFLASRDLLPKIVHVEPLDEGAFVREGEYGTLAETREFAGGLALPYVAVSADVMRQHVRDEYERRAQVYPYSLAFAAGHRRAGWIFLPVGKQTRPAHRRIRMVIDVPEAMTLLSVHVHPVFLDETLLPIRGAAFSQQLEHLNKARRMLSKFEQTLKKNHLIDEQKEGGDFVPATRTIWELGKSRMRNLLHQGWSQAIVVPVPSRRDEEAPPLPPPLTSNLVASPYALLGDVVLTKTDGSIELRRKRYVLIDQGKISAITTERPEKLLVVDTRGIILPGLIDLHDHISYNYFPRFSDTIFKGRATRFANRYEWQRDAAYLKFRQWRNDSLAWREIGMQAFAAYGEIRELVGGTTAVASRDPRASGWETALVRNLYGRVAWNGSSSRIGYQVFFLDRHKLRQEPPLFEPGEFATASIRASDVCILHLCEGRRDDPDTQKEFEVFAEWARNNPAQARKLILVHLVGLTEAQFKTLATLGITRAVWSPYSNMVLYGETMDVYAALDAGFTISLGTDWYPTGTDSLFDEFRYAYHLIRKGHKGLQGISSDKLLAMLLANPTIMLGPEMTLGTIREGAPADLVVIPNTGKGLMDSILEADVDTIQLVTIAGVPHYGEIGLMARLVDRVYPSPVSGRPWAFSFDYEPVKEFVERVVTGTQNWTEQPVPLEVLGDHGIEQLRDMSHRADEP